MTDLDLLSLTAVESAQKLRDGEISPVELADAYLDRIESDPDETGAYLHTDRAVTRAQAQAAGTPTEENPFAGVPIGLKDLLSTKDMPTTCASRILEGFQPVYDGTAVANTRIAGLVSLGKLNMDEFAMGSSTENSAYAICRNPWIKPSAIS